MSFVAGIVLYNPQLDRLRNNIESIVSQVGKIVLVDNGSNNISEITSEYGNKYNVEMILLGENLGIAAAQNQICLYAKQNMFEWAILLDQDSVSPDNLIAEYIRIIEQYKVDNIGMLCPRVIDRNYGELYDGTFENDVESIDICIASASAIFIPAWEKVGGFYEPLFIDKVDFDMCYSLRKIGYKIFRANNVKLLHEIGHGRRVHFAGKDRLILNHSPLRYYYIIRNSFIVGRRHGKLMKYLKMNIRILYQVNRYEHNKFMKNKMMLIGFIDGIQGKEGKYGR